MLGDDVACALQSRLGRVDLVVEEAFGFEFGVVLGAQEQALCERFESFLARHLRSGAAFGLERQVDVFDFRGIPTLVNALAQLVGECALCLDRFDDEGFSMLQFVELSVLFGHGGHGHFVHSAGGFFAIAGDEGNSGSFVEESDGLFYLFFAEVQPPSDELNGRHGAHFWGYTT